MQQNTNRERESSSLFEKLGLDLNIDLRTRNSTACNDTTDGGTNIAEILFKIRRKRDEVLGSGIFHDPAWDILLSLYCAEADQKPIHISSACLAAGVPASTGARWAAILIQNGHVEQHNDPADAGQSLLSLTPSARKALDSLFAPFESR
ncbi:MarR family winged helix-turn-helix transcriptional regulator [Novosphingobium mangrovi (ex Huang et al. 2023)]|uniref:MarR family winged helix-turn-helix transcriptional regulator n=1 Tax=Novosphingobium mangrovi (ex Huang et al. 2023) TaxID=2976432 RepID=A0ABT2I092_9SPHN|nr:MarR family winged helix-turn-helix transcriptional regulator [Novosphingobium mangrovi (ex Huang et al. 2023)]MCT2398083.1 MarR family winged helix-turn-helix transcriptional regulator [Novosphingobium mangrovi (ex Huang et al. 2023)]